jgi:hypothetical protein
VEKEHIYSEEQELSDTLDRRRGWIQYDYNGPPAPQEFGPG